MQFAVVRLGYVGIADIGTVRSADLCPLTAPLVLANTVAGQGPSR